MKGEGKNFELAECAMRRGASVRAYGCADEETVDVTVGERTGVLSKKRGGRRKKKGRFARKSTSFCSISPCSQKNEIFFSRNIRQLETKFLLLRLIKHNFPFIPPPCGVYIAQSRGTFPDPPAQMLFDLLKHRNFAISLPIETCPRRSPSQSGGNVRNTHVFGTVSVILVFITSS